LIGPKQWSRDQVQPALKSYSINYLLLFKKHWA